MITRESFGFELVHRAAIRALGLTGFGHIQENARMAIPDLHAGFWMGAKHAALGTEILGAELDNGLSRHERTPQTRVSQCAYFGLRPLTMSKNAAWIFSVIGPRLPEPI